MYGVKCIDPVSLAPPRPPSIPATPDRIYKDDGWCNWRHWLGTSTLPVGHGLTNDLGSSVSPQCKGVAGTNDLGSSVSSQCNGVAGTNPNATPLLLAGCATNTSTTTTHNNSLSTTTTAGSVRARDGPQVNMATTASTTRVRHDRYRRFDDAVVYIRSLNLKTKLEWAEWCKSDERPANIPSTPARTYKHDGWQGMGHWLGTGILAGGKLVFLPFKKALLYARTLKLKSQKEWKDWAKTGVRPANMPSHPDITYKLDGWQGYGHWLGTGNVRCVAKASQFLPFEQALLFARSLKLKNQNEWQLWRKSGDRPANIPTKPCATYIHDGWQGYGHWLGTFTVAKQKRKYLPFEKALLYVRSLKFPSRLQWEIWSKSGARPDNIPSTPGRNYKRTGWQGCVHHARSYHALSYRALKAPTSTLAGKGAAPSAPLFILATHFVLVVL